MTDDMLHADAERFDDILEAAKALALDHLGGLGELPASRVLPAAVPRGTLPETGEGALSALAELRRRLQELLVASPGPRYFGFVTGGVTPAALLGDWLTGVFDQNPQSPDGPGDVSARIEREAIDLLRRLLRLPETFAGGFVSGATMANFTGLGVARQWAAARLGVDAARHGVPVGLRVLAATPHSSALKALAMLGMGSANLTRVATEPGRERVDLEALERDLAARPDEPAILLASGGTVDSVDFDDFAGLAGLRRRFPVWIHADAAFGGFAACSPRHAHLLAGWEECDSITVDGHKWLNVPYDSGVVFVRREHAALQLATFQNSDAPYLGDPAKTFNFLNRLPENSRRLRALPAWFSLTAYGRDGHRRLVERCVDLARALGEWVERSPRFELAAPVRLNVVCLTPRGAMDEAERDRLVARLAERLARRGVAFLTPSRYGGRACLRAALVNWRTTAADVERTCGELTAAWEEVAPG